MSVKKGIKHSRHFGYLPMVYFLHTFISPSASVRTDNIYLPTVIWLYHRYRRYRWIRFFCDKVHIVLSRTSRNENILPMVNNFFRRYACRRVYPYSVGGDQRISQTYRWRICFSIDMDGQHLFTDGKLALPSVPSVPMDKAIW